MADDQNAQPTSDPNLDFSTAVPIHDDAWLDKVISPPQPSPAQKLHQSVAYGATQNPDAYAKLLQLKQKTGLSPNVIHLQQEQVQQGVDVNSIDYPSFVDAHPRTAEWASNPDNAAISHDDLKNLGTLESVFRGLYYGAKGGFQRITAGLLQAGASSDDLIAPMGLAMRKVLSGKKDQMTPEEQGAWMAMRSDQSGGGAYALGLLGAISPGYIENDAEDSRLASTLTYQQSQESDARIPQNFSGKASSMLGGIIPHLSPLAPATMTAEGYATGYHQALQAGASEETSQEVGIASAGINAALARAGMKGFTPAVDKALAEGFSRAAIRRMFTASLGTGTEFAAAHIANTAFQGAANPNGQSPLEAVGAHPEDVGYSFLQGMAFHAVPEMIGLSKNSLLLKRDADKFSELVKQQSQGTAHENVIIPVEAFDTYFQSQKMDPASVADNLGIANKYAEAKAGLGGDDVAIPTGEFLSKLDPKHQEGLAPDVRGIDPNTGKASITPREQEQVNEWAAEGGPERLSATVAQADAETQSSDEYLAVKTQLQQQYVDAGETPNVAENYATLQANVYSNLARETGMKPTELMELYRPVMRTGEAPSASLKQTDETTSPDSNDPSIFQQGERGWFRALPDGSFEIGKTKIGDLSTFIHEPAHSYLEIIRDLAVDKNASQGLKSDYGKILDFLGAKEGETLTTEQHEKWARANEQYLREGKAPSSSLRGVFQRFAVWLSSIYKRASDLGVELSGDIRGVMDRMYAAEEGVNRAEKEAGPQLFSTPEEAGWTDEQFQKYAESKGMEVEQAKQEILSKLNEAAVRERTDSWREEENNTREAVTTEIDRKPEYAAIRSLRRGSLDDGTELKLNRDDLVKQFGEERVKELQKQHPGLYRNEGGIDPEAAAEILGFDSAGKMMKVLQDTPRRSAAIEQATREYMTAKHGDIRYDGSLQEKATLALMNERRAENAYKELQALARKNNPGFELREAQREVQKLLREQRLEQEKGQKDEAAKQRQQSRLDNLNQKIDGLKTAAKDQKAAMRAIEVAPIQAYREAARQAIQAKSLADMQPTRYLDATRKFSREAFDALRSGKVDEAAQAKHKELMNHFLFREATKARELGDKIEAYAKRMSTTKELGKLGLAGQPFLEQIKSFLSRYSFERSRALADMPTPRQESLDQFVQRMKNDEGLELPIDAALLDEPKQKTYRNVPFSELEAVYDAMRSIEHAAKQVNTVRAEGERVALQKAATDLNLKLEDSVGKPEVRKSSDRARSFLERVKDVNLDIAGLLPEFMFERFDGLSKLGPWHDYFWNRYNDAADHQNRLREMVFPEIMKFREANIDRSKKFYIQSLDRTLTKDDIISIALNSGNESNLEKQMRGGIQFEKDQAPTRINAQALQEVLSHLTPDEIKVVNGIWKTIGTLKPEAAALERKRTGIEPKWIEPKAMEVANGTLEGGYYPLKYDARFSAAGEKQSDASTVQQMFAKYASSNTRQGYLKDRTQFFAPLSLDWQATVSRHLDEVTTDISHWEFATDAQRLLKNPDVKGSIIRNLGDAYYKNLLDWVRYTVNQDSMGREASNNLENFRRTIRNNITTAVLGYRVGNAVAETAITPLLALQHVSPESAFKGAMMYFRNPIEATKFAVEASDYVKRIDKEMDRNVTEALNDLGGKTSLLSDFKRWGIMSRVAIWKIGAVMAWHQGYDHAMRSQGLEGEDAVRIADSIYRMTQESGRPGDLSAVQRDPRWKELTMFIGPGLIQYNNVARAARAFKDQGLTSRTAAIGSAAFFGVFVNSVLFNVLRGQAPDDKEKWPKWMVAKMTLGMLDGFPVLRDVSGYAEGKLLGEHGKDFRLSPVLQLGKDTVDAGLETQKALTGEAEPGNAIKQGARTIGSWTGLPAVQGTITGQYVYDVMSGQYKPAHPWSPVTDALYARPKK